jgi:signal transduction protein with GAF and PtsI domain
VVSAYLAEPGGDELVMRGNVGFPEHAIGTVRLRVGEGITGFCASSLRPVSVAVASDDAHYKHVPGIGEELFPCFVAVPIFVAGRCAGVLVAQRRAGEAFSQGEVALSTALATPFAHALDLARARETRASSLPRTSSSAPARLVGRGLAGGAAVGRAKALPTFDGLAEQEDDGQGLAAEPSAQAVRDALAGIERDVTRTLAKLAACLDVAMRARLAQTALLLSDSRLRDLATAAARATRGCTIAAPRRRTSVCSSRRVRSASVRLRPAPCCSWRSVLARSSPCSRSRTARRRSSRARSSTRMRRPSRSRARRASRSSRASTRCSPGRARETRSSSMATKVWCACRRPPARSRG